MTSELRAGPLRVLFEDGGLRYVRLGAREVLRRVYVAVRDRSWDTVPAEVGALKVDARADSFDVSFQARARREPVDFAWKATIRGDARGTISFGMDGEANSAFLRNRIGLCVLHPIRECSGAPCRVTHSDGRSEEGCFPRQVSPHQPFLDIRTLSHEVAPGLRAEVRVEGDVFEMEDQRNWTDASYKIYSTPLALPIPVEVRAGTKIAQSVTLSLAGEAREPEADAGEVRFSLEERLPVPLPTLGHAAGAGVKVPLLRVDLRGADAPRFAQAAAEARQAGAALEIALHLAEEVELVRLAGLIRGVRVAHVLLFPPTDDWIALARKHLPGVCVGGGSSGHFAELNRRRPPVDLLDLVTFPASPACHAGDERTLVENVEAQGYAVESAREFSAGKPVGVSPIAYGGDFPAWVLGSVKYVAQAGAASATYDLKGKAAREALAEVAGFAGGVVLPTRSADPLRVDGLALEKDGRSRIFLANMTPRPERALYRGRSIPLGPHEVVNL